MKFSFGSDPEFILTDEKGKLKSAIGIVPGSRKNRFKFEKNEFFYDNVLAECTIEPSYASDQAVENVGKSIRAYSKIVSPLRLSTIASAEFPESEMKHKESRKAGCDVENCAYRMRTAPSGKIKKLFRETNFRTAGGHVHLGTELGKSHETCVMLVRMLDLFLGIPSLLIDNSPEGRNRRIVYGKPGRYRQPEYGVEYRTPGNFWFSSPRLVVLFFEICEETIKLTEDEIYEKFWSVDRKALDSDSFWNSGGDPAKCHKCNGYDLSLLRSLFKMDKAEAKTKIQPFLDIIFRYLSFGLKQKILQLSKKSFDIQKEWGITS